MRGPFCKSARDCTVELVHVGGAASENDDFAADSTHCELHSTSCAGSLREHGVQLQVKSRLQQLREKVYRMTESDLSDIVDVREFQREAKYHRAV